MYYIGITVTNPKLTLEDIMYLNSVEILVKTMSNGNLLLYRWSDKNVPTEQYEFERFQNNILRIPNDELYNSLNDDYGFHSLEACN